MTENQEPERERSQPADLPQRDDERARGERRLPPEAVEAAEAVRVNDENDPFYSGMLGSEDGAPEEPALDHWGRGEREREAAKPRKDGYEIGYGKPPKKHRFRPGQSGNPYGRPKRKGRPVLPPSLNDAIVRELARKQSVKVGDKVKKMSMDKLIAQRIVTSLATCDPKTMPYWLNSLLRSGFPQAVEELREREEERMRREHEERLAALESTSDFLDEFFEENERDEDYYNGKARCERDAAAERARGPRKPKY